jgi:hypothetical protein
MSVQEVNIFEAPRESVPTNSMRLRESLDTLAPQSQLPIMGGIESPSGQVEALKVPQQVGVAEIKSPSGQVEALKVPQQIGVAEIKSPSGQVEALKVPQQIGVAEIKSPSGQVEALLVLQQVDVADVPKEKTKILETQSSSSGTSIFDKVVSRNVCFIIVMGIILVILYIFFLKSLNLMKTSWNSEAFWNTCHFWLFLVLATVSNLSFLEALVIMIAWECIEVLVEFFGFDDFHETPERKFQNILADLLGFVLGSGIKTFLRPRW